MITLVTFTGCKSSKRSVVAAYAAEETLSKTKTETLGVVDTAVKIDLDELEVEVIKFEPVYYKKDGKDTVELKQVTYKRTNTKKVVEEVTKLDTTSTKSEQVETKQESDSKDVKSEYKFYNVISGLIKGLTEGFFAPFAKFAWILGVLLATPIVLWIKKKITGGDEKI